MEETIFRGASTTLYVWYNNTHKGCNNTDLKKSKYCFLRGKHENFTQEMGYCNVCKKLFILNNNQENLNMFCDYNLMRSDTHEKIAHLITSNWKDNKTCYIPSNPPKGVSEDWSKTHPLQGGGCSGK